MPEGAYSTLGEILFGRYRGHSGNGAESAETARMTHSGPGCGSRL